MLEFGPETTRLLEEAYHGSDFVRRRMANLEALNLIPGDRVVDIGCGPGLLTLEIARAVGEKGTVIGIDPSADMRTAAAKRCAGRSNLQILEGTANDLRLPVQSVDKAVSVQVFEYLSDIPGALSETRRVLADDGRLVIGDMHWDSLVWRSNVPDRMSRMVDAWDRHLADRCVPAGLQGQLREAGFVVEAVVPLTICDVALRPDGVANMLLHLIPSYALQNKLAGEEEVLAWVNEQHQLAAKGEFFFSITHYVVTARRRQ